VVDVGLGSTTAVLVARLTCPQYLRQLTTLVHRASWQRWANNGRGRTGLQRAAALSSLPPKEPQGFDLSVTYVVTVVMKLFSTAMPPSPHLWRSCLLPSRQHSEPFVPANDLGKASDRELHPFC
jgi:hypothetical protein